MPQALCTNNYKTTQWPGQPATDQEQGLWSKAAPGSNPDPGTRQLRALGWRLNLSELRFPHL